MVAAVRGAGVDWGASGIAVGHCSYPLSSPQIIWTGVRGGSMGELQVLIMWVYLGNCDVTP